MKKPIKQRIEWLLDNAKRLDWINDSSPYKDFCLSLERALENDSFDSDKELILMWTNSRLSEGYAHQLEPFDKGSESAFTSWQTVSEIHLAAQEET